MTLIRTFPMQNGPPIPYVLAELIHEAYARCQVNSQSLARISERGGWSWQEVSLIFMQARKKDRALHENLMDRARNLTVDETSKVIREQRSEVTAALARVVPEPPKMRGEPEGPDFWALHNSPGARTATAEVLPAPVVALDGQLDLLVDAPAPEPLAAPVVRTGPEPLTIVCWKWNSQSYRVKFEAEHVNILARMVRRCYPKPHRVVCITDDPRGVTECETFPLWKDHRDLANASGKHLPSCYRRLKLFSKEVGTQLKAQRILSIDLDVILTNDVSHIFDRTDPFVGWKVPGVHVDWVYNGSMFMFDVGPYSWIWETFDPERSPGVAKAAGYQGSDQGWLSYCLKAREPGWGRHDGVYSYPREVRHAMGLPTGSRLVIFHGQRKPWDRRFTRDRHWITKHYK